MKKRAHVAATGTTLTLSPCRGLEQHWLMRDLLVPDAQKKQKSSKGGGDRNEGYVEPGPPAKAPPMLAPLMRRQGLKQVSVCVCVCVRARARVCKHK